MIPVKIHCGCGQKYSFDVEPVGQTVGYAVQCPVCGADGTPAAEEAIASYSATATSPDLRLRIDGRNQPPLVQMRFPSKASHAFPATGTSGWVVAKKWVLPGAILGSTLIAVLAISLSTERVEKGKTGGLLVGSLGKVPLTLADLNAWYVEPPNGQNAATINAQGFAALQLGTGTGSNLPLLGKGTLPPPGVALTAPVKSAVSALVKANQGALQLLAQGATCEQSRYPVDLTAGIEATFPHLSKFKGAALVLELSAILHAEAHEGRLALDDIRTALALARSLEAEPSLSSQSVRSVTVAVAMAAWERTVNRTTSPPESLSEFLRVLKNMEKYDAHGEGFNRGLVAERAIWMALLDDPPKLIEVLSLPGVEIPPDTREATFAALRKAGKLKAEQRELEQVFEQLMAARQSPFPARLKADDIIQQHLAEATAGNLVVIKALFSSFAAQSAKEAELLTRVRFGSTSVALEQFRAAHSEYPTDLAQLTPEYLPGPVLDPFDGAPLRYRRTGSGYVLQSIGPRLQDGSNQRSNVKKGDIVFAVKNQEISPQLNH